MKVLLILAVFIASTSVFSGCAKGTSVDSTRPALAPPVSTTTHARAAGTWVNIEGDPVDLSTTDVSTANIATVDIGLPLTPSGDVRDQNQALVQSCFAKTAAGTYSDPHFDFTEACKLPDKVYTGHAAYKIIRQADAIHIELKLNLTIIPSQSGGRGSSGSKDELLKNIRGCIAPIREIWGRYGLKFDLSFEVDGSSAGSHHQVKLFDEYCDKNPDEGSFCYKGWRGREATRHLDVCRMILHETGHMLGLEDEYADKGCPDRPFISKETKPWSIMNDEWYPLRELDFYPRHIKTVLNPLCSK